MASPARETSLYPFTSFRFAVAINVPAISPDPLCNAAFAECDGLEMTMDVKTIREGGNNSAQIRLFGAVNYSLLTLKRGMTANFDLWNWFELLYEQNKRAPRGDVTVTGIVEKIYVGLDEKLKRAAALRFRDDRDAYSEAKSDFVARALVAAGA